MIGVVVVLLLTHSVSSIPISDFLPFNGPKVCLFDTVTMLVHKSNVIGSDGVSIYEVTRRDCEEFRLTPNNDGSSPNFSIGFTFPFFARRFRNLYVSTAYCYITMVLFIRIEFVHILPWLAINFYLIVTIVYNFKTAPVLFNLSLGRDC